mgnify:CR=1 FL=1
MDPRTISGVFLVLLLVGGGIYIFINAQQEEIIYEEPELEKIEDFEVQPQECGDVDTKGSLENSKIIIDAGHRVTETDFGLRGEIIEAEFTENVAHFLTLKGENIQSLRKKREVLSLNDRIRDIVIENSDMIISLHAGKENVIKAFVSSDSQKKEESKKLACLILNSIISNEDLFEGKEKIEGRNIISVTPEFVSEGEPQYILKTDRVAIVLELGDVSLNRDQNFLSDEIEITQSIYEGIRSYYE